MLTLFLLACQSEDPKPSMDGQMAHQIFHNGMTIPIAQIFKYEAYFSERAIQISKII